MPRQLKNLRIDDVSSVDRGAGRGVKVRLIKRAAVDDSYGDGNYPNSVTKREFSQSERESAADSGAALPDGSYPIKSRQDLKNAIQAVGRAKSPAKAKAHIKRRAEALSASDMIPDTWKRDASGSGEVIDFAGAVAAVRKDAVDFDQAQGEIEAREDAECLMEEVQEAVAALCTSIWSILADDDVADRSAAINESFEQFRAHIASDELEKAAMAASSTVHPNATVQKLIDDGIAAAMAKAKTDFDEQIAKKDREIAIAKMSDKHKKFHDGIADDEEKKKFAGMTPEERDAHMDKTRKRSEDDPVIKAMAVENDELKKRLKAIEDERDLDVCKREARELGMTANDAGEILMKARRGDREAMKKFEDYTKQLRKQAEEFARTGKVFAEFGKANTGGEGTGATAYDQLMAKAAELHKAKPDLTIEQAFAKVTSDPANKELVKRESDERMAKIHRAA